MLSFFSSCQFDGAKCSVEALYGWAILIRHLFPPAGNLVLEFEDAAKELFRNVAFVERPSNHRLSNIHGVRARQLLSFERNFLPLRYILPHSSQPTEASRYYHTQICRINFFILP